MEEKEKFVYGWNTENEVIITVSTSEEQARNNLMHYWKKKCQKHLMKEEDQEIDGKVPSYVLERAKTIISWNVLEILEVFTKPADFVLSVNKQESIIYEHLNE